MGDWQHVKQRFNFSLVHTLHMLSFNTLTFVTEDKFGCINIICAEVNAQSARGTSGHQMADKYTKVFTL